MKHRWEDGMKQHLPGSPRSNPSHRFAAERTLGRGAGRWRFVGGLLRGRFSIRSGRVPCLLLRWCEQGRLAEQGPHAVATDFGGRMEPAKGAHACKSPGQGVLEKAPHQLDGVEWDEGGFVGFAVAIVPAQLAPGQGLHRPVGGGGFENVTGQVTQRVFTGTGVLKADVPTQLPRLGRDLFEQFGIFGQESFFEERAAMIAQGFVVK